MAQERPVDVLDQRVGAKPGAVHPHVGEGGPRRWDAHLGEQLRRQPGAEQQVVLEARVQVDLPQAVEPARGVQQVEVDRQSELRNAEVCDGLQRRAPLGADRDVAHLLAVDRDVRDGVPLGEGVVPHPVPVVVRHPDAHLGDAVGREERVARAGARRLIGPASEHDACGRGDEHQRGGHGGGAFGQDAFRLHGRALFVQPADRRSCAIVHDRQAGRKDFLILLERRVHDIVCGFACVL